MNVVKPLLLCLLALAAWSVFALRVAFLGWWLNASAAGGDHAAFHASAVGQAETGNRGATALV